MGPEGFYSGRPRGPPVVSFDPRGPLHAPTVHQHQATLLRPGPAGLSATPSDGSRHRPCRRPQPRPRQHPPVRQPRRQLPLARALLHLGAKRDPSQRCHLQGAPRRQLPRPPFDRRLAHLLRAETVFVGVCVIAVDLVASCIVIQLQAIFALTIDSVSVQSIVVCVVSSSFFAVISEIVDIVFQTFSAFSFLGVFVAISSVSTFGVEAFSVCGIFVSSIKGVIVVCFFGSIAQFVGIAFVKAVVVFSSVDSIFSFISRAVVDLTVEGVSCVVVSAVDNIATVRVVDLTVEGVYCVSVVAITTCASCIIIFSGDESTVVGGIAVFSVQAASCVIIEHKTFCVFADDLEFTVIEDSIFFS